MNNVSWGVSPKSLKALSWKLCKIYNILGAMKNPEHKKLVEEF